jgi:hypothetical protein
VKHKKEDLDLDEQPEAKCEPERPGPVMIPISVIASKGPSSLVQWSENGKCKRGFVPTKAIIKGACPEDIIVMSIPHGAAWAQFIQPVTVSPERLADALYQAGFWTVHDIEVDPIGAQSAINMAVGVNAAAICRLARNSQREE